MHYRTRVKMLHRELERIEKRIREERVRLLGSASWNQQEVIMDRINWLIVEKEKLEQDLRSLRVS